MKTLMKYYTIYSGILTVCFEWSALIFFYYNKPNDFTTALPISYFATIPQTRIVFMLLYLLAAGSCWVFFRYYLSKYYPVPYKVFAFSLLCFIGVAFFPFQFTDSVSYDIHLLFAFGTFAAFILGLIYIGKDVADKLVKSASFLTAAICTIFCVLYVFIPKIYALSFFFEVAAWLALQIWIIWITIYTIKKHK